jgi:hypothetical protein
MKRLVLALSLALTFVRPAPADTFTQLLLGVDTTPTPSPVCIMSPTGICAAQLGTWNIGTSTWTPAGGGGGGAISFPQTVAGTTTSGGVPYFSSATQLSSSGLLAANALMVGGGAGAAPATVTTGMGVVTALGIAVNNASGFPLLNATLPTVGHCIQWGSSGLTDAGGACTTGGGGGTVSSGNAGQLTYYASTGTVVSGATTGTGVLTALGLATNALGGVLTTPSGACTSGQFLTFQTAGSVPTCATPAVSGLTVGSTTISGGTNGYVQYNNGGLLGEKATTGTGNVVLSASPTFSGTIGGTQVVPYSALVNIGANTVLGQVLAGTPTQLSVPSCSGTGQALNFTSGGGFGCATTSAGGTSAPAVNAVATCGVLIGGSVDQSTKINSCLATYSAVSFPCGTYYTTNSIVVASSQSIFGGGPYCTIFNINSTTAPAIHVTPTPFNVTLRDFAVLRTGTPTSGATGILIEDCNADVQIDHIWITGQWDGISLGSTAGGNAQFIVATENYGNGFILTTSASCGQPMQWNLLTTASTYNDGWGYYTNPALTGGDVAILLPWLNANSFANTAGGFGFLGTAAHPIHGVSLYNCVSSTDGGVNGGQIVINSGSGHTIKGCYIELPGAGTTGHTTTTPASNSGYGISLEGSNGIGWISIQNNNIANTAYSGISIAANTVYSLNVTGNMIHDPGWAANNTYDGIVTTSAITNGIISGNTVDHNASGASNANLFRNGINIFGTQTALSMVGNVVQESGSYGLFYNSAPSSYGMTTGNIFSGAAGGCTGTGYVAASNYHVGNVGGAGC